MEWVVIVLQEVDGKDGDSRLLCEIAQIYKLDDWLLDWTKERLQGTLGERSGEGKHPPTHPPPQPPVQHGEHSSNAKPKALAPVQHPAQPPMQPPAHHGAQQTSRYQGVGDLTALHKWNSCICHGLRSLQDPYTGRSAVWASRSGPYI
jgi:hypothetical protein